MNPYISLILENGKALVYEINTKTKDMDLRSEMSAIEVWSRKIILINRASLHAVVYFTDERLIFCPEELLRLR